MKKRIAMVFFIAAMIVTMCVPMSFASSGYVKSTMYLDIYKDGNNAYCGGSFGVSKINLKTGKFTRIIKYESSPTNVGCFSKKGKWIYFIDHFRCKLYRYNKHTGKKQVVYDGDLTNYAIRGKKVYVATGDPALEEVNYYVMSLNGKGLKSTKTKVKSKYKTSNVKGYKIVETNNWSAEKVKYYLKTPKGKKYYIAYNYIF